jgi:hypothetical protein
MISSSRSLGSRTVDSRTVGGDDGFVKDVGTEGCLEAWASAWVRRRSDKLNPNSASTPMLAANSGGQIDHGELALLAVLAASSAESFAEPGGSGAASPNSSSNRESASTIDLVRRGSLGFSREGSRSGESRESSR